MKKLKKSVAPPQQSFTIATWAKQAHIPGQVPSRKNLELEAIKLAEQPPQEFTAKLLLLHTAPIFSPRKIVEGLGLSLPEENRWSNFLAGVTQLGNEITLRQELFQKFKDENIDPALKSAIFQRAINYMRIMKKSQVEVYTPDDLKKSRKEHFIIYE